MKLLALTAILASALFLSACGQVSVDSIDRNARIASLDLNLDEQNIWKTLTPAQQDRAVLFIHNGGTLIASLGDK